MEGKMGGRRKKWKRMAELGMILTEADKIDTQLEPGKGSGPAPAMLHDDSNIPHLTKALLYYPYGYSTTKLGVSCIHESRPVYLLEVPLLSRRCAICRIISCFRS